MDQASDYAIEGIFLLFARTQLGLITVSFRIRLRQK